MNIIFLVTDPSLVLWAAALAVHMELLYRAEQHVLPGNEEWTLLLATWQDDWRNGRSECHVLH